MILLSQDSAVKVHCVQHEIFIMNVYHIKIHFFSNILRCFLLFVVILLQVCHTPV